MLLPVFPGFKVMEIVVYTFLIESPAKLFKILNTPINSIAKITAIIVKYG